MAQAYSNHRCFKLNNLMVIVYILSNVLLYFLQLVLTVTLKV